MVAQNPHYANQAADTPPFDPAFDLDAVALAVQRAQAALRRGDHGTAAEFAAMAALFATDAQRHLAVVQ